MDRLEAADVGVQPVEPLYLRPPATDSGVVLAFASVDEAKIRAGVAAMAAVLHGG